MTTTCKHHIFICDKFMFSRFSLSNDKYQVIKTPANNEDKFAKPYLGRSEKGITIGSSANDVDRWRGN